MIDSEEYHKIWLEADELAKREAREKFGSEANSDFLAERRDFHIRKMLQEG